MKAWWTRLVLTFAALVGGGAVVSGYVFMRESNGQPIVWSDSTTVVMRLQLGASPMLSDGSTSWDDVFQAGLSVWNGYMGRVQFGVVRNSTAAPGDGNGINETFFSDSYYGRTFDRRTLAVTTLWYSDPMVPRRTESDIIFNNRWTWDSYRGALRTSAQEFFRVATHEQGHVLGLGHPDQYGQTVAALMNSNVSNTDTVVADDIAGIQALYGAAVVAPGVPSNLTASASGSTVLLYWSAPTTGGAPSAYIVEAGSAPGLTNLTNFNTGSTALNLQASNVAWGAYYVRVRATNSAGTSAASNEVLLVVGGGCTAAPGAPSGLRLVSTSGGTVVLAWTPASGAPTTYIADVGSAPGLSDLAVADLGGTSTTLTAMGVSPGTYYVRIRSSNACGSSGGSNEVVVTV